MFIRLPIRNSLQGDYQLGIIGCGDTLARPETNTISLWGTAIKHTFVPLWVFRLNSNLIPIINNLQN